MFVFFSNRGVTVGAPDCSRNGSLECHLDWIWLSNQACKFPRLWVKHFTAWLKGHTACIADTCIADTASYCATSECLARAWLSWLLWIPRCHQYSFLWIP